MYWLRRTSPATKTPELRLDPTSTLAIDLIAWWAHADARGAQLRDLGPAGLDLTLVNTPIWALDGPGQHLVYTTASSQRAYRTDLPEVNSLTRFTCSAWMFRASTAHSIMWGRSSSPTNGIGGYWAGSSFFWIFADAGADRTASVANSQTGWHHFLMQFDGSGATNADKLKLWIDGAAQTLTFGTSPTTALPTMGASVWEIGARTRELEWGTGRSHDMALWRRLLSPDERETLYRNPLAMAAPVIRVFDAPIFGPPVGVFSDESPEDASTNQNYDGRPSIVFTPVDAVLNAVTAARLYLNGYQLDVTIGSLGPSGAVEISGTGPAYAGAANTIEVEVDTLDGATSTHTWTYTTRRATLPTLALSDYATPRAPFVSVLTDVTVPRLSFVTVVEEHGVARTGLSTAMPMVVEYAPQRPASGLANANPVMVDYYASLFVQDRLAPMGVVVAERQSDPAPMGMNLLGTAHEPLAPMGTAVSGTAHDALTSMGTVVAKPTAEPLAPMGVAPAERHSDPAPMGAALERVSARLVVEADAVSPRQTEVEEEP